GAPAPVLRRHGPQPAQVQAAQARSHSSRTFVTPRNMKRREPIACLLSTCRRKTRGTRAGPNSAAGRRGRRRSAYEAPRAAAEGGTRLGGAESKRRRPPRLPAPPSRVTLLGERAAGIAGHEGRRLHRQRRGPDRRIQGRRVVEIEQILEIVGVGVPGRETREREALLDEREKRGMRADRV